MKLLSSHVATREMSFFGEPLILKRSNRGGGQASSKQRETPFFQKGVRATFHLLCPRWMTYEMDDVL